MALPADPPRFLIVRRDNIGDLVCTTPLIAGLRARHPHAWIGALVNTYNQEVLARNPALDAVYAYEKLKHRSGSLFGNVVDRVRLAAELRARRLHTVLVPSPSPQALRLARWLSPGHVVAGSGQPGQHEVERAYSLGASLGIHGVPGPLRVYPDQAKVDELRTKIGGARCIAVHISARRPMQRWPVERYRDLVAALARSHNVVLLWAPGLAGDSRHPGDDALAAQLPERANVRKLATPDLRSLVAALSLSDLVVCPDGGAMHLAAAVGKPVVALFGDSPPERWRPWGVPHRVLQPPSRNLADLPLAPVLEACAALADERRRKDDGE